MSEVEREGDCVTIHPGFQDVCLNRWVLEVASLTLKTKLKLAKITGPCSAKV